MRAREREGGKDAPVAEREGDLAQTLVDVGSREPVGRAPALLGRDDGCRKGPCCQRATRQGGAGGRGRTPGRLALGDVARAVHDGLGRELAVGEELDRVPEPAVELELDVLERRQQRLVHVAERVDEDHDGRVGCGREREEVSRGSERRWWGERGTHLSAR